jgi:uridine monophosphate synthetase
MDEHTLAEALHRIGAVRFGSYRLKDGRQSPFYIDLRILVSHPRVLRDVAAAMVSRAATLTYDRLAPIPYAGLPIGVAMAILSERPLVYPRKEEKGYGTRRAVEGEFSPGERVLVVDDVVTSGHAKIEAISPLREVGLIVRDVLVVRRGRRAERLLAEADLRLHSLLGVEELFAHLVSLGLVERAQVDSALLFVEAESE